MGERRRLVLLDRDGVLDAMVVDPEHGTIDSPLHPDQVVLMPGVPEALAALTARGFLLAIVTNQPAAAKGKTTLANLEATHHRVLELTQARGGLINRSYLCIHRSEDACRCRKPRPDLLVQAMADLEVGPEDTWMVGDGVTDVEAGRRAGVRTAFLGPRKCDACKVFADRGAVPDLWAADLGSLVPLLG